jgi:hypothetical protein
MTTKILVAAVSLTALPALASDVSPFYKNQFAVTERQECATRPARESDTSPFYKNQFATPTVASCAALADGGAAKAHAQEGEPQHGGVARASSDPRS